jgi:hypothetical protein
MIQNNVADRVGADTYPPPLKLVLDGISATP